MSSPLDELLTGIGRLPVVPVPADPISFTVIVRTQGLRPRSLAEAMTALADQSHDPFDVIVAVHNDDPTTSDLVEAALTGSTLPASWQCIPVSGGGRARPLNAGVDASRGDYACFLDDDDLVTPDWLAAFARGVSRSPGAIIRAVTLSQDWATDGSDEPVREAGPVERPFAAEFDLLAHLSHNETPICSIALPLTALRSFDLHFDDTLAVFEDWDLLMRLAMLVGVESIAEETSLYRRLDSANANSTESAAVWEQSHARVLDRLSASPVLLPPGDARRLASAHFDPGGGSRHDRELEASRAELAAISRSPLKWAAVFARKARQALGHRIGSLSR